MSPTEPPVPTDPAREAALGRIAVWLDPDDARWLTRLCARRTFDEDEDKEREARVRFRLVTALHKAGLPSDPWE
jgi:hypothetical protein